MFIAPAIDSTSNSDIIIFFEYLSKESKNINEDGNSKLMKQKIDEITQKMDEIDKILDNKNLLEKYRITLRIISREVIF